MRIFGCGCKVSHDLTSHAINASSRPQASTFQNLQRSTFNAQRFNSFPTCGRPAFPCSSRASYPIPLPPTSAVSCDSHAININRRRVVCAAWEFTLLHPRLHEISTNYLPCPNRTSDRQGSFGTNSTRPTTSTTMVSTFTDTLACTLRVQLTRLTPLHSHGVLVLSSDVSHFSHMRPFKGSRRPLQPHRSVLPPFLAW